MHRFNLFFHLKFCENCKILMIAIATSLKKFEWNLHECDINHMHDLPLV